MTEYNATSYPRADMQPLDAPSTALMTVARLMARQTLPASAPPADVEQLALGVSLQAFIINAMSDETTTHALVCGLGSGLGNALGRIPSGQREEVLDEIISAVRTVWELRETEFAASRKAVLQ